jgi:hypothetical protein
VSGNGDGIEYFDEISKMTHINLIIARDPYALQVLCDYLEENAVTVCDRNLYLFLRARQHEERGFYTSNFEPPMNGDGYSGSGYGSGYGDGDGNGDGDGYRHDDSIGLGDEGNQ